MMISPVGDINDTTVRPASTAEKGPDGVSRAIVSPTITPWDLANLRTRQDGIASGDAFQSICNVVTVEDPVPQARIAEMRGIERANAHDVPS